MNLLSKCTEKEIDLIKQAGVGVEDKDYTEEELNHFGIQIEEYIMNHSSKNDETSKLQNEFDRVFGMIYK